MSDESYTSPAVTGSTTQARGCHITLYDTAAVQVANPTDGVAILQQVMALAQNPITGGVAKDGQRTSDDSSRNVRVDANAASESNRTRTSLAGTNSPAHISHAPSAITTEEPITRSDTIPIDVNAIEPGSPESPIYVDALDRIPSPNSQRSDSPDITDGLISHSQLRLSVPRGNETPFCCHPDGTPVQTSEVGGRNRITSNILTSDIPPGFIRNDGLDFIPFPITDDDGITQHPDYIHVVMIDDPFVLAVVQGNPHVYGQALHITPHIPDYRRPQYDLSDLIIFRARHDRRNTIDNTVRSLGDKSATAEVHHWRNLMVRRAKVERELRKVLQETCDIGEEQEHIQARMESANLLARLDNAATGLPFDRRGRHV